MDTTDFTLLRELQNGLPLVREPFNEIAKKLALSEPEVLERVRALQAAGVIRKFRARIDQRRVGITANALVAWSVPQDLKKSAALILASARGVTHCYERQPVPGIWEYILYTVHHGHSREIVVQEVSSIARSAGLAGYIVLFSTEEFKRSPAVRIGNSAEVLP